MVFLLPEDESFTLTANVTTPGYQRVALKGYLVRRENNGIYVAPIIPQLFYGWDGTQLTSWRQNIGATGSQVILSRGAGGLPKVPKQDLYWRKIAEPEEPEKLAELAEPVILWPVVITSIVIVGVVGFCLYKGLKS